MELKCRVARVLPIEKGTSKSGKEWQKATLIVEHGEGQYVKQLAVVNMKHAEAFAQIPIGSEVTMQIEAESREFNGKWYTSVSCWKWDVAVSAAPQTQYQQQVQPIAQSQPQQDCDPLPF